MLLRLFCLLTLLLVSACGGSYRPGTDGRRPTLPQNEPANAQPQPAGSLPR